jgi:hypothetical protein
MVRPPAKYPQDWHSRILFAAGLRARGFSLFQFFRYPEPS